MAAVVVKNTTVEANCVSPPYFFAYIEMVGADGIPTISTAMLIRG